MVFVRQIVAKKWPYHHPTRCAMYALKTIWSSGDSQSIHRQKCICDLLYNCRMAINDIYLQLLLFFITMLICDVRVPDLVLRLTGTPWRTCASFRPPGYLRLQMFLVLGIAGMPGSWVDVLTLDLGLNSMLEEAISPIAGYISVFGTLLAFVRPTLPGNAPRVLRTLFPLGAWLLFSDEATVSQRCPWQVLRK